jgi:hypothetical protein
LLSSAEWPHFIGYRLGVEALKIEEEEYFPPLIESKKRQQMSKDLPSYLSKS